MHVNGTLIKFRPTLFLSGEYRYPRAARTVDYLFLKHDNMIMKVKNNPTVKCGFQY